MLRVAASLAFALVASAASAQVTNVIVPGTADPWLAGMPAGATASLGDTAPAQSPVLVGGPVNVALGGTLRFSATGEVSNTGVLLGITPDGQAPATHTTGAENGIATLTAPVNGLIGVFLDATQPDLAGPPPGGLSFTTPAELGYATLSPALRQPFFIGDGLTGTGSGTAQVVTIPAGATRLYLAAMDGFGWFNNAGQFAVTVTQAAVAPPPAPPSEIPLTVAPLAALALAVAALTALRRRR
ncbi:MAG TPA: PEP-CTERM sorting domain-containing protein [Casimicrobiaceae bacterium]|nr:PEP-CTERM sorting domain-containing protein [Casimicrobiaceae bacterium]